MCICIEYVIASARVYDIDVVVFFFFSRGKEKGPIEQYPMNFEYK